MRWLLLGLTVITMASAVHGKSMTPSALASKHLKLVIKNKHDEAMKLVAPSVFVQISYKDGSTSEDEFKDVQGSDQLKSYYFGLGILQGNRIEFIACEDVSSSGSICALKVCNMILPKCRRHRMLFIIKDGLVGLVRGVDDIRNPERREALPNG